MYGWTNLVKDALSERLRLAVTHPELLRPALQRRARQVLQGAGRNVGDVANTVLRRPVELQRLHVLWTAPTEMNIDERLMLYALVRGHRPLRALEIGTSKGGSGLIIATAMDANSAGHVVSVDPVPLIEVPEWLFRGRFRSLARPSPEGVDEARALAGGPFDLILIDGIHIYDQVAKDLAACLPNAAEGAYILLHDAFHLGVREAVREAVERHPQLHDCGYVCGTARPVGDLITHGGFRLLRVGSAPLVDPAPLLRSAYAATGISPPDDPDLRNHDFWYCEAVEPCAYCRRVRGLPSPSNGDSAAPVSST